jgi:nucleotide-binding universal stress UspA family protein
MGIARHPTGGTVIPPVQVIDGVEVETNDQLLNARGQGPVAVIGANYCEFSQLVLVDTFGLPVTCDAPVGSVSMFSELPDARANLDLAIRALRRAGATVIASGGFISVTAPQDDEPAAPGVTGVETSDGSIFVADVEPSPEQAQELRRALVDLPGRVIRRVSGEPEALQAAVDALGVDAVVVGFDQTTFVVGLPSAVDLVAGYTQDVGRGAVSIPLLRYDEAVASLLSVGSVRLAYDPQARRLNVAGHPEEVRDVVRIAQGLFPRPESRSVRVSFLSGSAENLARVATQAGGALNLSDGVIRFGEAVDGFQLALDAMRSSSHIVTDVQPAIRVVDGVQSSLRVGAAVPVITGLDQEGRQQVEYRDVGTILRVRTLPDWSQIVTVELTAEVSSVDGSGVLDNPTFQTRTVETTVQLRPGEVVILSGFVSVEETNARSWALIAPNRETIRARSEMHLLVTVY